MYSMFSSSIAAISTPKGSGGIAVIRISGKDSIAIADRFVRLYGKKAVSEMEANTALPCRITDENGDTIDTAVVTVFRAPRSFTGEDTVEISCHGGIIVSGDVLGRALECGAVPAGPGRVHPPRFFRGKAVTFTSGSNRRGDKREKPRRAQAFKGKRRRKAGKGYRRNIRRHKDRALRRIR